MSVMLGYQLSFLLCYLLLMGGVGGGGEKRRKEGRGPLNGWMDGRMELMKFIEVVGVPH